jgi:hypothetical protein
VDRNRPALPGTVEVVSVDALSTLPPAVNRLSWAPHRAGNRKAAMLPGGNLGNDEREVAKS